MKALVTGGAGFIGSHLTDRLLQEGASVVVLDDLSTGSIGNISRHLTNPAFRFVNGSILDIPVLESCISDCDIIYHLAALVGVKFIVQDPLKCIIANVTGTENVLSSAFRHWKKTVVASSSEVYGKSAGIPYREDQDRLLGATHINRWCYAETKAIDEYVAYAYGNKGLPIVILRFFNCYGPRINEEGYGTVVAQFVRQALRGDPITVFGDGAQTRCFTYVEDLVGGVMLASQSPSCEGEALNIGTDRPATIEALAHLIKELTGSSSEVKRVLYADYYGQSYEDTPHRVPDIGKARRLIGFEPQVDLREGLTRTIDWCRTYYGKLGRKR
ncbi:MAG: GDP-mannose 4,6-dehydratase [Armatimonadetes bacterium]|nr:GDP-mannose 4,6-dehydratase [Armatimonadota bacterium]